MGSPEDLSEAYGLTTSDFTFQTPSPRRFSRFRNKSKRHSWNVSPLKPINELIFDSEDKELATKKNNEESSILSEANVCNETPTLDCPDTNIDKSDDVQQPASSTNLQKFSLGDMLWAKVGNHPWWPCMCYCCPDNSSFNRKVCRNADVYHVQFFGPQVERAWIPESNLLRFKGHEDFQQLVKLSIDNSSNKKEIEAKFSVPARKKEIWDASWREAETALAMDVETRKMEFGRVYEVKNRREQFRILKDVLRIESEEAELSDNCDSDSSLGSSLLETSSANNTTGKRSQKEAKNDLLDETIECIMRNVKRKRFRDRIMKSSRFRSRKDIEKPQNYVYEFQRLKTFSNRKKINACCICEKSENHSDYLQINGGPVDLSDTADTVTADTENPIVSCAGKCGAFVHADCGYKMENVELLSSGSVAKRRSSHSRLDMSTPDLSELTENCANTADDPGECEKVDANDVNGNGESLPSVLVKCVDCHFNIRRCLECREIDEENSLIRCSTMHCRRFYHLRCVIGLGCNNFIKLQNNTLHCPAHICHSCVLENPGSVRPALRYIRCLYCSVAYHIKEACLPAGSIVLSNAFIICPRHGKSIPASKYSEKSCSDAAPVTNPSITTDSCNNQVSVIPPATPGAVINVTWCFICSKGGHIICCETCPASFHTECLKLKEVPEKFICENCECGRYPLYGEILWCKIGRYRWWPCEALTYRNVPEKVKRASHKRGQFVAHLFGTDEYHWVSRGRVFPFEEGDEYHYSDSSDLSDNEEQQEEKKSLLTSPLNSPEGNEENAEEKVTLDKVYSTALQLAGRAVRLRSEKLSKSSGVKPDHFKITKCNYPIGNVKIFKTDLADLPQCDCGGKSDQFKEDPCGITSECMNRELLFECHPTLCRHGKDCRNQNFVQRNYPKQIVFKTDRRGWGLKAGEKIAQGQFVNEYVGDLIDEEEANIRLKWAHENSVSNYYMMKLDGQRIIDAGPRGNLSRFMNHSCLPNLYAQKWSVQGDLRVGLFALKEIAENEEMTFNYNFMSLGQEKLSCKCEAPNCSGYLGVQPKAIDSGENPSSSTASTPSTVSASEMSSNSTKKKRGRKRLAASTPKESQPAKKPRISTSQSTSSLICLSGTSGQLKLTITKTETIGENNQNKRSRGRPRLNHSKIPSTPKRPFHLATESFAFNSPPSTRNYADDSSETSTIPCRNKRSQDPLSENMSVSSKDTDKNSTAKVIANKSESSPRKRGRPRKFGNEKSSPNNNEISAEFQTKSSLESDITPQKRQSKQEPDSHLTPVSTRDLITKSPMANNSFSYNSANNDSVTVPIKRPRGRPRKIQIPEDLSLSSNIEGSHHILESSPLNGICVTSPDSTDPSFSVNNRLSSSETNLSINKSEEKETVNNRLLVKSAKDSLITQFLETNDPSSIKSSQKSLSLKMSATPKSTETTSSSPDPVGVTQKRLSARKKNGLTSGNSSHEDKSAPDDVNTASTSKSSTGKRSKRSSADSASAQKSTTNKKCSDKHDAFCYRCGDCIDSGPVQCSKHNCVKSYHLTCLSLSKAPNTRWYCPWHHCDTCGRSADHLCSECSTSYCSVHYHNNIFITPDKKVICMAHDELLTAFLLSAD